MLRDPELNGCLLNVVASELSCSEESVVEVGEGQVVIVRHIIVIPVAVEEVEAIRVPRMQDCCMRNVHARVAGRLESHLNNPAERWVTSL